MGNAEPLEKLLDNARRTVKTDSYPMSIGELAGMYEREEIVLRPEYQRYFRWSTEQKSKLIESILIGLPLPSVFVSQDDDGNWEVVDGMQRLSTIFDFMGILKPELTKSDYYLKFNKLTDELFYLGEFKDKGWNDFGRRIQLDVKRTKIQLTILLRETDLDAKFELFQRLNSGGTAISGQELRNAIMAGNNPKTLKWFEELADDENFKSVCALAGGDLTTRFDVELVLRFVAFLSPEIDNLPKAKGVDVFLTSALRNILDDDGFDYDAYKTQFQKTFKAIMGAWGADALKYKNKPGTGKFSISFFEAVALGVAQNLDDLPNKTVLKALINSAGTQDAFRTASGSGKNAQRRIPALLLFGKDHFGNG
ncbi:MAG: hypothetical protein COB16_06595 [Rhodobacteraceae bacterium]|nr:MAG: hypothetical protein COB16_06595 [Paracoccaceae bacterium]